MQAFKFFLKDVLHAFDEENKILQVRKVSNRANIAIYWILFGLALFFYQKRVRDVRRLFKKDFKNFIKNTLLVRWKHVYKKKHLYIMATAYILYLLIGGGSTKSVLKGFTLMHNVQITV